MVDSGWLVVMSQLSKLIWITFYSTDNILQLIEVGDEIIWCSTLSLQTRDAVQFT